MSVAGWTPWQGESDGRADVGNEIRSLLAPRAMGSSGPRACARYVLLGSVSISDKQWLSWVTPLQALSRVERGP